MEDAIDVRAVRAEETRDIRLAVLRPGRPRDELIFRGDDDPATFHAGAFVAGTLVAVGRLSREAPKGEHDDAAWRVRSMATLPEHRNRGAGRAVLDALLEHARERGASQVWCHARVRAVPFYERAGFGVEGDEFDLAGIGPHRFMRLRMPR